MKEVKKRDYTPKTKKIAIDLGLRNLFATDKGDLIGRNFIEYLSKIDKKINYRKTK
jgi:putative transposase